MLRLAKTPASKCFTEGSISSRLLLHNSKRQRVLRAILDIFLDNINDLRLEELKHQLLVAQNSLEAIEEDLEDLMALRDAYIIRVAAMTARLSTLQEFNSVCRTRHSPGV